MASTLTDAAPTPGADAGEAILRVSHLDAAYGDVQVLWDVSLEVRAGEIVALVGSNGAGRTTLLSAISGLVEPAGGEIVLRAEPITYAPTQRRVELGLAHVPEGRRLFAAMSVRDQLLLGAYKRRDKDAVQRDLEHVLDLFPRVRERLYATGGTLSGGEQQMVAVARALMGRPRLLMIDELSLGLAPVVVEALTEILTTINREGTTILLVEQDVQMALEVATRGYVLEAGHVTLAGPSATLLHDARVRQAYLGI